LFCLQLKSCESASLLVNHLQRENEDCSNAGHQGISTSLAQEEQQLRPRGVVPGGAGAGGAIAPPDFGRPQPKPTVNWVLGAGLLREDQTTQQPQQLPIHQQNTQQLTPQWYGASSMSSLQSNKSIEPALSNNYQIKSNLLPITLDTTKSKSFPANKKISRSSKNETKIPRTNPSKFPPIESIYPEYWPDQRGKNGHICCYYCGIQSHERSRCNTLWKDILENGSDYRAFHPLRGELSSKKGKKNSEPKPSKSKPSIIPRVESIYPEHWPDQKSKEGHPCCHFCGGEKHERSRCLARDKTCSKCQKMGHFGDVCQSAGSENLKWAGQKSIEPAPSNNHQIKSNLSPINLDTTKFKKGPNYSATIASLFL